MLVDITYFFNGFFDWFYSLSTLEKLLVVSLPFFIDIPRSIGRNIFLLLYSIYKKIYPENFNITNFPSISLILPAHNEEGSIRQAIESVIETNYSNKEIIVVDDGSTDRTYEFALPYAKQGKIKLFKKESSSGSKAGALNYGITFATGDIIIVVDSDSLIERQSVYESIKQFTDPSVVAVSGNVKILSGDGGINNLLTRLQSYEYLLSFEIGRRFQSLTNTLVVSPGAFTGFRSNVGKEMGLFDIDTITEDFDFSIKLRKSGYKIVFSSKAVAWTFCPSTWRGWIKQRKRWSHGQVATLHKHIDLFWKNRYGLSLIISVYDMIIMDIFLLMARFFWFISIILYFPENIIYASFLTLILALIGEFSSIITASLLSRKKHNLKKIYLSPFMVFFYRPIYTVVRLIAYMIWFKNRKTSW